MVFQFMLHLVFEEDELKTTPVTVKGLIYLGQTERRDKHYKVVQHVFIQKVQIQV